MHCIQRSNAVLDFLKTVIIFRMSCIAKSGTIININIFHNIVSANFSDKLLLATKGC